MRRLIAFLLAAFTLTPGQATAQAFVQAGEHSDFTRVVTRIPEGADWQATQQVRQVTLSLSGYDGGFDTRRLFDIIPRDRLLRAETQADRMTLDLACDCRVAAFDVAGGYVALDILSPGARPPVAVLPLSPAVPEPTALVQAPVLPNPRPLPLPLRSSTPDRFPVQPRVEPEPLPAPVPVPNLLLSTLPKPRDIKPADPAPVPIPDAPPPSPLGRDTLDPEAQRLLLEIQDRLSRELGTAATRGVLEPRGPSALPDPTRPQIDTGVFADELARNGPALEPPKPGQPVSNIRISTSMDLPKVAEQLGAQVSIGGIVCPAPATFDVVNWAEEGAFDAQISSLRQALYGEFDRLDPVIAKQLAQAYIYFGFGADARQILSLDSTLAQEEDLLLSAAENLENGYAAPGAALGGLMECTSDASLWAMLAHERLPENTPVDATAALLALSKLPVHLRRILAPGLSARLLAHGDTDAAASALRSLERLPEDMQPNAMLAQARISLKEGENDTGKAQLQEVINAGTAPSPDALIALIDEKIARDQPIDAMTAGLAEAYAKELVDTDLGPDLRRANVLALMKSSQFDRAFAAAATIKTTADPDRFEDLQRFMLRELTVAASDTIFVDLLFQQPDDVVMALPRRDRLAVIERLLALGFPQSAQRLVETLPDKPPHPPTRMLAARIAMAVDQPMLALERLADIDSEAAEVLRAEAKQQAGAHAEAHDIFSGNDREWDAVQSGWLAEDWQARTSPATPVFGPLVTLATNTPEPVRQGDGMLSRSDAVLEESSIARQTILDLLNAPLLDPDAVDVPE